MTLWLLLVILFGCLGVIGFYQGAIRVGFSLVGLLLGALLALPLGYLLAPLLKLVGLQHPVVLSFVAPVVAYLIVLIAAKSAGFAVHKKVDTYYKYKESDTKRMLWERLNARVGICLGLANATVYVFLISIVAYIVGYFTVQAATGSQDSLAVRWANVVARDVESTGMARAVSACVPARKLYYDAVDVLAIVFHTPLVQSRLGDYPAFLKLEDHPGFQSLARDTQFQEQWQRGISFREFFGHENIQAVVRNIELYTNVLGLLNYDLDDLKAYLVTGKSARFEDERILGRWDYNFPASLADARRKKPNMGTLELRALRRTLSLLNKARFTAYMDQTAAVIIPADTNSAPTTLRGRWRNEGGGRYHLRLGEGRNRIEGAARIENDRLYLTKDGHSAIFEK